MPARAGKWSRAPRATQRARSSPASGCRSQGLRPPPPNCRLNRPLHGFSKMRSALTDACGTPQGAQPASARNFCCGLKAAATCQQKIPRDNTRREEGEETSLNKRLMLPIMLATHRCKARGCKAETAVQHCGLRAKGKASSGHFAQYCCNGPPTRRPVLGAE